ncbi:hypothetical protein J6590_077379 [Homalodisca vitripennis]|nr:hypothetical protein J6590_077379 [Homalodisca vitripennis]
MTFLCFRPAQVITGIYGLCDTGVWAATRGVATLDRHWRHPLPVASVIPISQKNVVRAFRTIEYSEAGTHPYLKSYGNWDLCGGALFESQSPC